MASNEKPSQAPDEAAPRNVKAVKGGVGWSNEEPTEPWHADSSIPASETLSDLPEPAELEEERPEETEETEETDEEEPVEAEAEDAPVVRAQSNSSSDDADDGRGRSKTIARKQMLRERRRMLAQGTLPEVVEYERPISRSECREAERPCLYVSCRYHLYLDVNPITGSIKINFPDKEPWELAETCALDVAEKGGITLEEVGDIMNLTRERIRQVEVSGLDKLRDGEVELETFLDGRELVVGGKSPEGQRRLPIIDD
jgi:hypothetical protein